MLNKADIARIERLQKEVQFWGTPENGYLDSGLWRFLDHVYTKDEGDSKNPVKKLMGDKKDYMYVTFLFWLSHPNVLGPKSRQIRESWMGCAFCSWVARSAPYRNVIYQCEAEKKGWDQTSHGAQEPRTGRVDFIEQALADHGDSRWLMDPNIISGKGNRKGMLLYSPDPVTADGVRMAWHGSRIFGVPQGANQARQYTLSLLFSDEAAHQSEYANTLRACAAAAHRMIGVSSLEYGSHFNDLCTASKTTKEPDWENYLPPGVDIGLKRLGIEWPLRGMRSRMAPGDIVVLETHHNADPDKDASRNGKIWLSKEVQKPAYAMGGFESISWRTEMGGPERLDYGAGGGERVFPFLHRESPVRVPAMTPDEVRERFTLFAGYDYGSTNPSAYEVIGIDRDGIMAAVWELYEPCKNLARHAQKIKDGPYFNDIQMTICDASLAWKTNPQTQGDNKSIIEQFADHGVVMKDGRRGQDYAIAQKFNSEFWGEPENPTFLITAACPALWKEVCDLRIDKHISEAVAQRKNALERIQQKDNHAWDATTVIVDAGMYYIAPAEAPRTGGTTAQDLIDKHLARQYRESQGRSGIHVQ